MSKPLIFWILACAQGCAQAAGPAPSKPLAATSHPIAASWSWSLPGKSCTESLTYGADGMRSGASGEERTQASYAVSPQPGITGFYRLTEVITQSNAKGDCAGDLHEVSGEPLTRFIQFSPDRNKLLVCREDSLKACFGPLLRKPGQG